MIFFTYRDRALLSKSFWPQVDRLSRHVRLPDNAATVGRAVFCASLPVACYERWFKQDPDHIRFRIFC